MRSGIALAAVLVGCGSSGTLAQAPPDGSAHDGAGAPDGSKDASVPEAAGGTDAGAHESGADGNGATDAGTRCGSLGEPCCSGAACSGALVCANGVCGCSASSDCPTGGTCTSGHCLVTIASNQSAAYLLTVNSTHVSWANWTTYANTGGVTIPGSIVTAPLDGGAPVTLFSGDIGYWWTGFASDAQNVYWAGHPGLAKTPIAGAPTQLLAQPLWCYGIAVDTQNAYCSGISAALLRVPLGGGTPVTMVPPQMGDSVGNPGDIVLNAGTVYWNDGQSVIESLPSSGGPATTIVGGSVANADLAMNASALYWLTPTGIGHAPLSGGAPTTVAIAMGSVQHMTVDDASVYWTDSWDGTVLKAPLGGGVPSTLYAGDKPWAIAVDDTSVYWTSASGGTVMRLTPK